MLYFLDTSRNAKWFDVKNLQESKTLPTSYKRFYYFDGFIVQLSRIVAIRARETNRDDCDEDRASKFLIFGVASLAYPHIVSVLMPEPIPVPVLFREW